MTAFCNTVALLKHGVYLIESLLQKRIALLYTFKEVYVYVRIPWKRAINPSVVPNITNPNITLSTYYNSLANCHR